MTGAGPLVGFACLWGADPQRTWSGTPWALRAALLEEVRVVDVGPSPAMLTRAALKATHVRLERGRLASPWRWSQAWEHVARRSINHHLRRERPDAVLQIGDFGSFDVPYFLYQDLNYDVLAAHLARGDRFVPGFEGLSRASVQRRRVRQQELYSGTRAVFAMSHWFADVLVRDSGVPREKVHVVLAGTHAQPSRQPPGPARPASQRTSLLFLGRDFIRKGGPEVVEAAGLLRAGGMPVTLAIAGPRSWPLPGDPPPWVDLRGDVSPTEVAELLRRADVMVLPSHFEAFGIAFAEARAHGLPCVGRRTMAMPEFITDGRTGALIDSDDPADLAEAIERVLRDDAVHDRCRQEAPDVARRYSWDQVARSMVAVMENEIHGR